MINTIDIEHKLCLVSKEYEEFRRLFNFSREGIMLSVSKLNNTRLQLQLQRFIELTDRFEQIEAKLQGICYKQLYGSKKSNSLVKIGDDEISKLKNEVYLEQNKNLKLAKLVEDLKQGQNDELQQLKENLAEYIGIANKQYAQINILKERIELLNTLVPAISDLFEAVDNFSLAVTQRQENDIPKAKLLFEKQKGIVSKLIADTYNTKLT